MRQLDFKVLGPLEISGPEGTISLAQGKLRAVLGVLLMHANEVVTSDRLIEQVWGERRPATAIKSVHVYVSQIRGQLGSDAIVTRSAGYELRLQPAQLDLHRFEQLRRDAAHGDPATGGGEAARGTRPVARLALRGLHLRRVRADDDRPSRGAAARHA